MAEMKALVPGISLLLVCGPIFLGHAPGDLTGAAASGPASAQAHSLPDTPAGRCARAYLAAFNSGAERRMTEFVRTYWPSASASEVLRRVNQERGLRDSWGTLKVVRVAQISAVCVTCLVRPSASPEWLVFRIELAKQAGAPTRHPPAIERFTRTGAGTAAGRGTVPEDEETLRLADRAMPIDAELRDFTVQQVADTLEHRYVIPDAGRRMAEALRRNRAAGAYDDIRKAGALADRLTADAQAVHEDRHLFVEAYRGSLRTETILDAQEGAGTNYGFRKAELLPGNIGYVKFDEFSPKPEARAAASAALAFVQNCRALILDLRENHGGWPQMMQFAASYLFEQRTRVSALYDRDGRQVEEWWTIDSVPGKRFPASTPVFVLTSARTASAAEAFTRLLQSHGRAKVVGEKTPGASHPSREIAINDCFMVSLPFLRSRPETDVEGIGVVPDSPVPAERALEEAVGLIPAPHPEVREQSP